MMQRTVSLELSVGDDGESTLGDFIPDAKSANPGEATDNALLREQIRLVLSTLSGRERVRQIETKALRKLRHPSRRGSLTEMV